MLLSNQDANLGFVKAVTSITKYEGVLGFYAGFSSGLARIGSWNTFMFLILEQTKIYVSKNWMKEKQHI